ncbi:MAG: superoxide dismutase [Epulopiscium sp. Nele67-Bin004]|nr:MAG: superoxide dismutase [Epulopiscium sp. Nele67-Bin004]
MAKEYTLRPLPYAYDALEPSIDETTVHIHHDKHQQAYLDKCNAAISKHPELFNKTVAQLLNDLGNIPGDIKKDVTNQGGGVFNHTFFWENMSEKHGQKPIGNLKTALENTYGTFEEFKAQFKQHAITNFGSGWTWLVKHPNGDLQIINMANQDTPISSQFVPLVTIDLWEHAYYLKYQNLRADFIENFFDIINWERAEQFYNLDIIEFCKLF